MITCTKLLRFCAGHRLLNHEGKCAHLHGHNYRAEVTCEAAELDDLGRVVDFSVIKERVGAWIDEHWDHGFIYNTNDREVVAALAACPGSKAYGLDRNPTAENIAARLLRVSTVLLRDTGCTPVSIRLWETETCYADVSSR